ncbi:sensor histidine kinase [Blastococcus haudaquaticus]|uniref:Oxygen sensor histidine kinase NreB n=1 Tax=Blastococcus haudaquaticus TaxID=1938745 RepID=A0A286H5M8_9ACTN|nr:sensor histidine kinase [Blastococcus haudaquaticus]SOE03061.1 Signal transduction histidine kinase [Blastococcus haudaquaticus]
MTRALAVLTCGAFITLVAEATGLEHPLPPIAVALVFSLVAVLGFRWVDRQEPRRRRRLGVLYVLVQLPMTYLVFMTGSVGVGATLLTLVLVSQSVLLLPLPGAVVVAAVVPLVHLGMPMADGLRTMLGTYVAAAFTAVVTELLRREQRARAELARANARLRDNAAQLEELATTRERNRVARDIHDGLGHHLTVVQMQVQAARAVLAADPARADAVLAKAQQQSTEALAEVRRSVAALREPRVVPPLPEALEALVGDTSGAGIPTDLQVTGTARPLGADAEESLFRTAQEGLTNVRKHAAAASASVVLAYGDDGIVRLEVRDDGCGTAELADGAGFGLLGLRERAARLGGSVDVVSRPGSGTTVRVAVPG